ncbi:MAG TPA: GNAT family protein [Selenomonadales bacterium]|nr:GNAT family protein [Selenomonadales bacterium]
MEHVLNNGATLAIRPAVPDDAADFAQYLEAVAGQSDFLTFGPGEVDPVETQRKSIGDFANRRNGIFLVAEVEGRIVGCLTFRRGKRPKTAHTGEFGITVLQDFWGLGIGRRLLGSLINWAGQTGEVRKINLRVRTDNSRGIALYHKMGFAVEGRITRDLRSNGVLYDVYTMGLNIDPEPALAGQDQTE